MTDAPRWYRGPVWGRLPGGSRAWALGAGGVLAIVLLWLYLDRPDPPRPPVQGAMTAEGRAVRDTIDALRDTVAGMRGRLDSASHAVRATSGAVTSAATAWTATRASGQAVGRDAASAPDSVPVLRAIIAEQAGYIARLEASGDSLAAASAALQRNSEMALTLARVQLADVDRQLARLRAQADSALAAERAAALDAGHAAGFRQGRKRGLVVGAVLGVASVLGVLFVAK